MVKYAVVFSKNSYVWHEDVNIIKQFLLQHNYPEKYFEKIEVIDTPDTTVSMYKNTNYHLEPYFFGSNINPKEKLLVYTTNNIIHEVYDELYSDIEDICVMADLIRKVNIPIIKSINDLIYELPYVFIMNYVTDEGMDEYENEALVTNMNYVKLFDSNCRNNGYAYKPTVDQLSYLSCENFYGYINDSLKESMEDARVEKRKQPITIECYVAMFLKVLKTWGEA